MVIVAGLSTMLGELPKKTALFPTIVLSILAIIMVAIILKALFMPKKYAGKCRAPYANMNWKGIAVHGILLILYVFGIKYIGFYVSSFALVFILCCILQKDGGSAKMMLKNLVFTAIFMVVYYAIFGLLFAVNAPKGILF